MKQKLLVGVATVLIGAGILYAAICETHQTGAPFSKQLLIYVPANVTQERLATIVSADHGELIGLAGIPSDMPDVGVWIVDVPWARDESDTDQVRKALSSVPEIERADLNSITTLQ